MLSSFKMRMPSICRHGEQPVPPPRAIVELPAELPAEVPAHLQPTGAPGPKITSDLKTPPKERKQDKKENDTKPPLKTLKLKAAKRHVDKSKISDPVLLTKPRVKLTTLPNRENSSTKIKPTSTSPALKPSTSKGSKKKSKKKDEPQTITPIPSATEETTTVPLGPTGHTLQIHFPFDPRTASTTSLSPTSNPSTLLLSSPPAPLRTNFTIPEALYTLHLLSLTIPPPAPTPKPLLSPTPPFFPRSPSSSTTSLLSSSYSSSSSSSPQIPLTDLLSTLAIACVSKPLHQQIAIQASFTRHSPKVTFSENLNITTNIHRRLKKVEGGRYTLQLLVASDARNPVDPKNTRDFLVAIHRKLRRLSELCPPRFSVQIPVPPIGAIRLRGSARNKSHGQERGGMGRAAGAVPVDDHPGVREEYIPAYTVTQADLLHIIVSHSLPLITRRTGKWYAKMVSVGREFIVPKNEHVEKEMKRRMEKDGEVAGFAGRIHGSTTPGYSTPYSPAARSPWDRLQPLRRDSYFGNIAASTLPSSPTIVGQQGKKSPLSTILKTFFSLMTTHLKRLDGILGIYKSAPIPEGVAPAVASQVTILLREMYLSLIDVMTEYAFLYSDFGEFEMVLGMTGAVKPQVATRMGQPVNMFGGGKGGGVGGGNDGSSGGRGGVMTPEAVFGNSSLLRLVDNEVIGRGLVKDADGRFRVSKYLRKVLMPVLIVGRLVGLVQDVRYMAAVRAGLEVKVVETPRKSIDDDEEECNEGWGMRCEVNGLIEAKRVIEKVLGSESYIDKEDYNRTRPKINGVVIPSMEDIRISFHSPKFSPRSSNSNPLESNRDSLHEVNMKKKKGLDVDKVWKALMQNVAVKSRYSYRDMSTASIHEYTAFITSGAVLKEQEKDRKKCGHLHPEITLAERWYELAMLDFKPDKLPAAAAETEDGSSTHWTPYTTIGVSKTPCRACLAWFASYDAEIRKMNREVETEIKILRLQEGMYQMRLQRERAQAERMETGVQVDPSTGRFRVPDIEIEPEISPSPRDIAAGVSLERMQRLERLQTARRKLQPIYLAFWRDPDGIDRTDVDWLPPVTERELDWRIRERMGEQLRVQAVNMASWLAAGYRSQMWAPTTARGSLVVGKDFNGTRNSEAVEDKKQKVNGRIAQAIVRAGFKRHAKV